MRIGVIGINHKSADLSFRERFAKACQRRFGPDNSVHDYVLLSTCNRTEVYFSSDNLADTHISILGTLRHDIDEEYEHKIYSYFGSDCFFHLARVTAGMDSAILCETEIQGQVKQAYEAAMAYHSLPRELHYLFQKCLKIGKNVRTSLPQMRGMPSLEEAILNAAHFLLGDLQKAKVLFVGVSEINHKVFTRFKQKGLKEMTFCNRSQERAEGIAKKEAIQLLPWEHVDAWPTFDVTIFGTKCPDFLVSPTKQEMQGRKLVIDLSVPRNVDPRLGRHPKITLLNVDQLNRALDRKRRQKALELARVETHLIATAVDKQVSLFTHKEHSRLHGLLSQAS